MTKFYTRSKGKHMSNLHIFGTLAAAGGGGGGPGPYIPVSEPSPNAAALTEYNTASEYSNAWADFADFSFNTGVQVSGGALYGISGANPSLTVLPFSVTSGETVRVTCEIEMVAPASGNVYIGFVNNLSVPGSGVPGGIIASFTGSGIGNYVGSGVSTATRFTAGDGGSAATASYTVTAVATPDTISISIRHANGSQEGNVVYNRSAMPTIAGIAFWNSDTRGLSGSRIKAFGVKRSLTPFRVKAVSGQTFEGNAGQVHHLTDATNYIRVQVPKGADGATPMPLCLIIHAVAHDGNDVHDDMRYRPVLQALENAGYMIASPQDGVATTAGFRWSNSASVAQCLRAITWARDHFYISGVVVLTVSGGTVVGHNLILNREVHVRGIYSICGVLDMPAFYTDQASFQGGMNTAWGASNLATFEAAISGWNPTDEADAGGKAVEYTGKRARFAISDADPTVKPAQNTNVLQPVVSAYALESAIVTTVSATHMPIATFDPTDIVDFFDRCFA